MKLMWDRWTNGGELRVIERVTGGTDERHDSPRGRWCRDGRGKGVEKEGWEVGLLGVEGEIEGGEIALLLRNKRKRNTVLLRQFILF